MKKHAIIFFSVLIVLSIIILLFTSKLFFFLIVFLPILLLYFFVYILIPLIKIERITNDFQEKKIDFNSLVKKSIGSPLYKALNIIKKDTFKGYNVHIENKQAEINYLQRQINPHFLYNSLDSIRGMAMSKHVHEIANITEMLSSFFRYSITQKGSIVSLREEIENVNDYFSIQQYRFDNKFSICYTPDKNDTRFNDYYLPKLTIQPLIENAIYHGLEKKIENGHINIRITFTDISLIINIIDDGVGMPKEKLDFIQRMINSSDYNEKDSIALFNVNKRIKLNYGEEYGIHISSALNFGTDVEITLPLITSKDVSEDSTK